MRKKILLALNGPLCHANSEMLERLIVEDIHLLGDAKKVTNIMYSIWDSFEVANHI